MSEWVGCSVMSRKASCIPLDGIVSSSAHRLYNIYREATCDQHILRWLFLTCGGQARATSHGGSIKHLLKKSVCLNVQFKCPFFALTRLFFRAVGSQKNPRTMPIGLGLSGQCPRVWEARKTGQCPRVWALGGLWGFWAFTVFSELDKPNQGSGPVELLCHHHSSSNRSGFVFCFGDNVGS